jgi:two-component system phosphate regulon sensor histidine kinase PhoR
MSLSLRDNFVQVYWFNLLSKNNDEQFKFHVTQIIGNVADKLQKQESYNFDKNKPLQRIVRGKFQKDDILEFYYVQKNPMTNKTIIYSNSIISEDYNISNVLIKKI